MNTDIQTDPRIDAYIERAPAFAQPILLHIRSLVHDACPHATETIKWGQPFFLHRGAILCAMSAFKAHCRFIFWHPEVRKLLPKEVARSEDGFGSFGRITSVGDIPPRKEMLRYLRYAVSLAEAGGPSPHPRNTKPKPVPEMPADLKAALKKNKPAAAHYESLSASHRREYLEWILDAKRDETRRKRVETTVEWLAEGKSRNWKYSASG